MKAIIKAVKRVIKSKNHYEQIIISIFVNLCAIFYRKF